MVVPMRTQLFCRRTPYLPFIEQLDGYVFTDERKLRGYVVKIYRDVDLPSDAIRIQGDKSCVSRLLGVPTILFDDKWGGNRCT